MAHHPAADWPWLGQRGGFCVVFIAQPKAPNLRPEIQAIHKLERKLAQLGYRRKTGETLGDFVKRLNYSEPQFTPNLTRITRLFEQVAYQNQAEYLVELEQAIKQFPR